MKKRILIIIASFSLFLSLILIGYVLVDAVIANKYLTEKKSELTSVIKTEVTSISININVNESITSKKTLLSTTKLNESSTAKTSFIASSTMKRTSNSVISDNVIKIKMVDKNGDPVSNLKIDINHISGDPYNYAPNFPLTDSNGFSSNIAAPKKYNLSVKDVEGNIIYNSINYEFEVKKNVFMYSFVWPYQTPLDRKKSNYENLFNFELKYNSNPIVGKFVRLYSGYIDINGKWPANNAPEIYDIGYSNESGVVSCSDIKPGNYTIVVYLDDVGESKKVFKYFSITENVSNYYFEF